MPHSDEAYRRRKKVLDVARELARSGQYEDHKSIISHLETLENFEHVRDRLEDSAFRVQLDKLCAMARAGRELPVEVPQPASTRT